MTVIINILSYLHYTVRQIFYCLTMASKFDCESSVFNLFLVKNNSIHNEVDPDVNFFQDIPSFDTNITLPLKSKKSFKNFSEDAVSIFHVNIRSTKISFENFEDLYYALVLRFSIICFSETWADDSFGKNDLYQLKNNNVIHQIGNGRKGVGLCIFVHESLCYNIPKDLCTNNYGIETLATEIENKRSKNIILNVIYRQPNGENHFNDFFSKNEEKYKNIILVGDFNINILYFENNKKVGRKIFESNVFSQYDSNKKLTG